MDAVRSENLAIDMQPGGIALLWLDVSHRPHNVLSGNVRAELEAALDRVAADPGARLLVILSRKPAGFCAGADLDEFKQVRGAADAAAASAAGQRLFDKLAGMRVPSVAVIHGVCLGGGLELALACDRRVVVDEPTTSLGLPEIRLGILPAWGGTQRLPRAVGIERAIQVILMGKQLNAADALRWGLADARVETQPEAIARVAAEQAWHAKRPLNGPPARGWRQRLLEGNAPGRWLLFRGAKRIVRRTAPEDMPGPLEALEAMRIGLRAGMAAGLAYEREAIGRLATTRACRNLVTLYFLNERARKGSEESAGAPGRSLRKVGVVGAGTMGAGIAQLAAVKGFDVVVQEANDAALASGVQKIEGLFRRLVERGRMSADESRQKMAALGKTTSWEGFADVDLVIEAVVEDLALKRKVFAELESRTRPDTILATNTSSLSVAGIQEGLPRPGRVAGLHFFNPVHKMILVEVVWGPATDRALIPGLCKFAADLGKTPVAVRDSTGFLVNRILFPYLNEAGLLVAEGMAVNDVDRVMRRFGMLMGPLELLDQIGLDVAAYVARTVAPVFGARLRPHAGLEQMVQRGWLGRKSGAGFYRYGGKKGEVNAEARSLLGNGPAGAADHGDARERMVLLMVNEAAACLGEGLATTADAIDLAMVLGTGWAPHRGGPLRYADDRGAGDALQTLERLARRYGPRFEPCGELRRRAQSGELFYDALATASALATTGANRRGNGHECSNGHPA
jgi:3-hydroxyacyl-CoA dehydrogenase/enoyl-CoA hydratase/3-hydroxybutyryl-CoA epimerase